VLYAEDLEVGQTGDLGSYEVTSQEMVGFADQWDPQLFHTDPAIAQATIFGAVIASGIYTLAVFQRLAVLAVYRNLAVVAGRAIRNATFLHPVVAGDVLHGSLTVTRMTSSRQGRVLVFQRGVLATSAATVLTVDVEAYVWSRPAAEPA
jgi:acyl dehydratase